MIKQYCCIAWSAQKIQKVKIQKLQRKKTGRIMHLSKYEVCDSKMLKFIKEQEASGLLSSIGVKTSLSQITLACSFLF